jgi:hypothetical protein
LFEGVALIIGVALMISAVSGGCIGRERSVPESIENARSGSKCHVALRPACALYALAVHERRGHERR